MAAAGGNDDESGGHGAPRNGWRGRPLAIRQSVC